MSACLCRTELNKALYMLMPIIRSSCKQAGWLLRDTVGVAAAHYAVLFLLAGHMHLLMSTVYPPSAGS